MSDEDDNEDDRKVLEYLIQEDRVLGQGNFGNVFEGHRFSDSMPCAIKVFKKENNLNNSLIRKERDNCNKLMEHEIEGVVKFYDQFYDRKKEKWNVVMEKLEGGELISRLAEHGFSEKRCSNFMCSLLKTINSLHEDIFMVHGDLKLQNIVYLNRSPDSPFRIIDFGLSIILRKDTVHSGQKSRFLFGTKHYLAPETNFNQIYSSKSDMFAVGVILYATLTCSFPFNPEWLNYEQMLREGTYDKSKPNVSQEAYDLIDKLLHKDKDKRYSAKQALAHPFITRYNTQVNSNSSSSNNNSNSNSNSHTNGNSHTPKANPYGDEEYMEKMKHFRSKELFRRGVTKFMYGNFVVKEMSKRLLENKNAEMLQFEKKRPISSATPANADTEAININGKDHRELSHADLSAKRARLNSPGRSSYGGGEKDNGSSDSSLVGTRSESSVFSASLNLISIANSSENLIEEDHVASPGALSISRRPITEAEIKVLTDKFIRKFSQMTDSIIQSRTSSYESTGSICASIEICPRMILSRTGSLSEEHLNEIDFDTFHEILDKLNLVVFAQRHIFDLFDDDDDGFIDYRNFLSYLITIQSDNSDDKSIRLYFELFDSNGDGKLSVEEFQMVLGSMINIQNGSQDYKLSSSGGRKCVVGSSKDPDDFEHAGMDPMFNSGSCSSSGGGGGGSAIPAEAIDESGEIDMGYVDGRKQLIKTDSDEFTDEVYEIVDPHDNPNTPRRIYSDPISAIIKSDAFASGHIRYPDFRKWMKENYQFIRKAFIPPTFLVDSNHS